MPAVALGPEWLDANKLIESMGAFALVGLVLIIFAECGLLFGFFLPGDSLLVITGVTVATGALDYPIWLVCTLLLIAAVLGNLVGYGIGRLAGPALFDRPNSRLFKQEYVEKTSSFFEKYGGRAIILARFVPIVRTFITAMAGVGRMNFRAYAFYSTVGGVLWAVGLTLLGWSLAGYPWVTENLEAVIIAIVLLSLVPMVVEHRRARRLARQAAAAAGPTAAEDSGGGS